MGFVCVCVGFVGVRWGCLGVVMVVVWVCMCFLVFLCPFRGCVGVVMRF